MKIRNLNNLTKIQTSLTIVLLIVGIIMPAGWSYADDSPETIVATGDATGIINIENNVNTNSTDLIQTDDIPEEVEVGEENSAADNLGEEYQADEQYIDQSEASDENNNEDEEDEDQLEQESVDCEQEFGLEDEQSEVCESECEQDCGQQNENDMQAVEEKNKEDEDEHEHGDDETAIDKFALEVKNDNTAVASTTVSGEVNTGQNKVENEDDDSESIIRTGRATLISNILNIINTNMTGYDIMSRAYNLIGNILDNIDLSRYDIDEIAERIRDDRDYNDLYEEYERQRDEKIKIENDNEADISNEVELKANTGKNKIIGDGVATIETGDVVVASNLMNIVNTNITGSNWTLAIVNIVGSWDGHLILPPFSKTLQDSDSSLLDPCDDKCGAGSEDLRGDYEIKVKNENNTTVINEVEVVADTGANTVAGEGNLKVQTGQAISLNQILNMVNTNIFGNNWVFGMVNVTNGWDGAIWGVPDDNFTVNEVGKNIIFTYGDIWNQYFQPVVESPDPVSEEDFSKQQLDEEDSAIYTQGDSDIGAANKNEAVVINKVKVYGNSGNNEILGKSGDATVRTGDVYALSNMMNFVNTNLTGDNWTMAIVNVVGSWSGDVSFGMPDLSLMELAIPDPDPPQAGGRINYVLTVTNKGDLAAHDVALKAKFDPLIVDITETDGGEIKDNFIYWNIDEIGIGETIIRHYQAYINPSKIDGANLEDEAIVLNHSDVYGNSNDRNPIDNTADTQVVVGMPGVKISGVGFPVNMAVQNNSYKSNLDSEDDHQFTNPIRDNSLKIIKSNNTQGLIRQGQSVTYYLDIENTRTESLYDVYVFDQLFDPDGKLISDLNWTLGEVFPGEKIKIDYTINYSDQAPYGTYRNQAWADGFSSDDNYLIFPPQNNLVVIRQPFAPEDLSVNIVYEEQDDKYVGQAVQDIVKITNNGAVGLPQGNLIVVYDRNLININGEDNGSFSVVVPDINPGESLFVPLSIEGIDLTDRAEIHLAYWVDNQEAALLTKFIKVSKQILENVVVKGYSANQRKQESLGVLENLNILKPQVLGVAEAWAGLGLDYDDLTGGELNTFFSNGWSLFVSWLCLILIIIWLSWWNKRLQETLVVKKRKR